MMPENCPTSARNTVRHESERCPVEIGTLSDRNRNQCPTAPGIRNIAVLVTGDADFVPLARALMKEGIRVMGAYFEYDDNGHKSFINERLARVCNYTLNINDAQNDRELKALFKGLFKRVDSRKMQSLATADRR